MVPGVNFVTTGEGSFDTKAGVAVDTANGGNALVYFPTSRSITLAMSVFTPTSIRLRWYDPTAGTYTDIGTYPNTRHLDHPPTRRATPPGTPTGCSSPTTPPAA